MSDEISLCGGINGCPRFEQAEGNGQQGGPEKNPDETEGHDTAEDSEEYEQERKFAFPADQIGSDKVIHTTDQEESPDQYEDAPPAVPV